MPRTLFLAHLGSHMAVEVGDTLSPPGASYSGKIAKLDLRRSSLLLECPAAAPEGRLNTSLVGCGIVWMDEVFVRPRPDGAVDHSAQALSLTA